MSATSNREWHVVGHGGFEALKLQNGQVPEPGSREVLVQFKYASLNFRDLMIAKGIYPLPVTPNVIAGSDGAGVVTGVGSKVTRFKVGDQVAGVFAQAQQAGPIKLEYVKTTLGGGEDGVLRDYAVLPETGLVHIPQTLSLQEASTLACAGVTAWNALYGLDGRRLVPGQWVLTQGTGGVSIFALQFAKAAGARVIATTSSALKAEKLKQLGADHVIDYKETPDWGVAAKQLTGGQGVDNIIEVGGPKTQRQSLAAVKPEGLISIIGAVGGEGDQPGVFEALTGMCVIRGVLVGSQMQFEEMNACIDANKIKPVVDEAVFEFQDLQQAYQYMWEQKHFGKLTVKIS